MHKCAMCGGRFPGPGIQREGQVYCCDRCAQGKKMKAMVALEFGGTLVAGLVAGLLIGRYIGKR